MLPCAAPFGNQPHSNQAYVHPTALESAADVEAFADAGFVGVSMYIFGDDDYKGVQVSVAWLCPRCPCPVALLVRSPVHGGLCAVAAVDAAYFKLHTHSSSKVANIDV